MWVFSGGLRPPRAATVVRSQRGEVLTTDGPYTEGKEHVGGVVVLRVADRRTAQHWAARLSEAATLPVEVRPFEPGDAGPA